MPIYEYKCPAGHVTEKLCVSDKAAPDAIECEAQEVKSVQPSSFVVGSCDRLAQRILSVTGRPVIK